MPQISLHRELTAAFLSAARPTILAFALLHVRANEKDHFRTGLDSVVRVFWSDDWLCALSRRSEHNFRNPDHERPLRAGADGFEKFGYVRVADEGTVRRSFADVCLEQPSQEPGTR